MWPIIIGAVAGVLQAGIAADAKKVGTSGGMAGGMDLGKMMYHDSSMNNSGWVVTTSGSRANVTANTDRTTSPSTTASATLPQVLGVGGQGGLDLTTILMIGGILMLMKGK